MAITHQRDIIQRPGFFSSWERRRHSRGLHWLIECFAESLGVFFYVYAGVGASAAAVFGVYLKEPSLGSTLQVGFGYAFGILFAITICSGTSGGHFNPCVSIAFVFFKGFPPLKALRYIVAQIFGGYVACLLIYAQYKDIFKVVSLGLEAQAGPAFDSIFFSSAGPAGIIVLYAPAGSNLARVFLNEFVTDVFLGLVIWSCLDPSNLLIPPYVAPWSISFAYAVAIWGYSPVGLAANAARDVGGRLAGISIWGKKANGGKYAALAALTNIPAMITAALIYEIFLTDSDRVIGSGQLEFLTAHKNHLRSPLRDAKHDHGSVETANEKGHIDTAEHV